MKPPAFQFYAAEYLADEHVQLMTLEEEGAYIRLLAFCWREGSIPGEKGALSRLCKGASEMVISTVLERFTCAPNSGRLIHARLEVEREKQSEWREKSAKGGRAGAHKPKKREKKDSEKGGATKPQAGRLNQMPSAPLEPNGNSSSASSSASATTKKEKKEPSAFAEFMKFLSHKIGPIPNGGKEGKAINWLVDNGYDFVVCCDCWEHLNADSWRTSTVTWTTVKAEIGGWLAKGKTNGTDRQHRTENASDRRNEALRNNLAVIAELRGGGGGDSDQGTGGQSIATRR